MEFSPFGPIRIARELLEDPYGKLCRAWEHDPAAGARPIFLRRFAPALRTPRILDALQRRSGALDLPRACGAGHVFGTDPEPHWKVLHKTSRSLRRIHERCRAEAFPLDPAISLHLALTLAHTCAAFWRRGLSVGVLSLDTIRVDFEGGLFLPDFGWMPALIQAAEEDPALREAFPALPRGPADGDLGQEGLRFGRFLYEVISHEPLPSGLPPAIAIEQVAAWTPEGPRPIPAALGRGLARLLGSDAPFGTLDEALAELEAIVYDGEAGPTTFHLAHLMHTLFRADFDQQEEQLAAEAAALEASGAWWTAPAPAPEVREAPAARRGRRLPLLASAAAAAGLGLLAMVSLRGQGAGRRVAGPAPAAPPPMPTAPSAAPGLPDAPPAAPPPRKAPAEPPQARSAPAPAREKPVPVPKPAPVIPGGPDRPAAVRVLRAPEWPAGLPKATVVVRVFVHEDGHPLRAEPEAGARVPPAAVKAAVEAAMASAYQPAVRGGAAVRDWVEVAVKP